MNERLYLYDTTLRDGAQTQGVDFTAADKVAIAQMLDQLGIDYIEGGWPGANPTDDGFFANPPTLAPRPAVRLRHDEAGRAQRRQRSGPRDAVPGQDRRRHPGRQELDASGRAGAGRLAGREPAHDRGEPRGGGAPRAGGDVRRRAFFRRLRGRSRLCGGMPRGGEPGGGPLDRAVRHQWRPPAARGRKGRRAGDGDRAARAPRHPYPQRHRERGRQHARGRAGRRTPGPGHAERPGRALRQCQPGQPDPDADPEDGLRDRRRRATALPVSRRSRGRWTSA